MDDLDLDIDIDDMLDEALNETVDETPKTSKTKKNKNKKKKKKALCSEAITIENCAKEVLPQSTLEQWVATLRKDSEARIALEEKLKEENRNNGISYMPSSKAYEILYQSQSEDGLDEGDNYNTLGNIESIFHNVYRDATNVAEKGKQGQLARPIHVIDRLAPQAKAQLCREYLIQVCKDVRDRVESNEDYLKEVERFPAIQRMLDSGLRNDDNIDDDMYD